MTSKRKEQIRQEIHRRIDEWLKHSTFEEMSFGYSLMRFDMSLGLMGYPFKKPEWMKGKNFNRFLRSSEDNNLEIDEMIKEFYNDLYKKNVS